MDTTNLIRPYETPLAEGGRTVTLACSSSGATVVDVTYPAGSEFDTHVHAEGYVCLVRGGDYREWSPGRGARTVEAGRELAYAAGSRHAVRVGPSGASVLHIIAGPDEHPQTTLGPLGSGM